MHIPSLKIGLAVIGLLCLPMTKVHSQVECINQTLQEMVAKLPLAEQGNGDFIIPTLSKECPITFSYNAEGLVSHIGFKLFNREIITKHPSPIFYFLERYLLQLMLLPDNNEVMRQLKSDRVKITSEVHNLTDLQQGITHIVSDDISNSSIYTTCNNNLYTVSCMKGSHQLIQISFPVRYELITGYNKLEAESSFYPALLKFTPQKQTPLSEIDMDIYQDSLYCTNNNTYGIQEVLSTSYYDKRDEKFVPIFRHSLPKESIYNLFNSDLDIEIPVHVTQSLYGKTLDYTIPLDQLTTFLRSQQCQLYTGISEITETSIKGMVIAMNMELGYQHLISFSCPTTLLTHPTQHDIKAKMYCFTPIHNISSLYNEKNK